MAFFRSFFIVFLSSCVFTAVVVPAAALTNSVLEFCPQYQLPIAKADIIGVVLDIKSSQHLYCEYHVFEKKADSDKTPKKTKVEYRAPDQTLIATKSIDYSPSLVRPNVVQKDLRNNELRSTLNSENIVDSDKGSTVNVSYRKPNSEEVKSTVISLKDMIVIDAGFDEAVKEYWYTLTRGEKLIIDFLSPVHLRTFKLTVKQSNTESCYKEPYNRETQACFLIRPSNMVLNLFVKPLALIYDLEAKRLLRFKGDVNVTDARGDIQKAVIQYYYKS
jgi:hypothetical protein